MCKQGIWALYNVVQIHHRQHQHQHHCLHHMAKTHTGKCSIPACLSSSAGCQVRLVVPSHCVFCQLPQMCRWERERKISLNSQCVYWGHSLCSLILFKFPYNLKKFAIILSHKNSCGVTVHSSLLLHEHHQPTAHKILRQRVSAKNERIMRRENHQHTAINGMEMFANLYTPFQLILVSGKNYCLKLSRGVKVNELDI